MNKTIKLIILLFYCFLIWAPQKTFAQNTYIRGVIKDQNTGETLIGATVKITGSIEKATVTNAYGVYLLNVPKGKYSIAVSYIGYQSIQQTIDISAETELNFNLVSLNELSEVVVVADQKSENVVSPQMGIQKLDVKDIRNIPVLFGERDIIKTLQLLPGIKSAGEGNTGFYVRGGATDQNLILLDEAPVYNASHLLGFFSTFNSDAIKDVTVYKGGMPSQYGGRLSSVLDIKMNDGNRKEFTYEGGLGLISSRLKIEGPFKKDKSSFMVSGRRTYADLFLKFSSDTSIRNNILYFYDLNAKANFQLDNKNVIYLSGYFGRDKLGLSQTFGFDWGNATATLRWNHIFSNKLFSNTSLIYSNYNYIIENFLEDNNFKVNSSIRDINLKQDFQYAAGNNHELRYGLNFIHHTIAPGKLTTSGNSSVNETTIQNRKGLELAAYFSDQWRPTNKFSVVYGLRLSQFALLGPGTFKTYNQSGITTDSAKFSNNEIVTNYFNLEPRLSMSYQLDADKSIKSAYTRNTQHLHLMSNSTTTSPTDLYIMNSNNVKPEIADQVSSGYFANFKDDQYEFSAEVYYKWMQNQIEYRNGTDLRGNREVEADLIYGKGRAYGLELFLKKRLGDFNGWVGYTLSKTERQFDQINQARWFNARQDRTHDISVVGIYKYNKRWTFSSTFVYATGNAVTFPSGKYQLNGSTVFYYSDKNAYRAPDYHRLDLAATLEGKPNKKYESSWSFSIYNAYARKNAFSIDFREDPDNANRTQAVRTTLFGIIPSVTWNFKF